MSTNNSNIAATIIPTDSGKELLQDIYGESDFAFVEETEYFKKYQIISDEVYEKILNSHLVIAEISDSTHADPSISYAAMVSCAATGSQTSRRRVFKFADPIQTLSTSLSGIYGDMSVIESSKKIDDTHYRKDGKDISFPTIKMRLYKIKLDSK